MQDSWQWEMGQRVRSLLRKLLQIKIHWYLKDQTRHRRLVFMLRSWKSSHGNHWKLIIFHITCTKHREWCNFYQRQWCWISLISLFPCHYWDIQVLVATVHGFIINRCTCEPFPFFTLVATFPLPMGHLMASRGVTRKVSGVPMKKMIVPRLKGSHPEIQEAPTLPVPGMTLFAHVSNSTYSIDSSDHSIWELHCLTGQSSSRHLRSWHHELENGLTCMKFLHVQLSVHHSRTRSLF